MIRFFSLFFFFLSCMYMCTSQKSVSKEFKRGNKRYHLEPILHPNLSCCLKQKNQFDGFSRLWLVFLVTSVLYAQVFGQDDRVFCLSGWCFYCKVAKLCNKIMTFSFTSFCMDFSLNLFYFKCKSLKLNDYLETFVRVLFYM